jgi:hypothetical protein
VFFIVVSDVLLSAAKKSKTIIGEMQLDVVVLDSLSEPFDPDIVQGTAFAIHGYLGFEVVFHVSGLFNACVLTSLVRIDYYWFPVTGYCKLPSVSNV